MLRGLILVGFHPADESGVFTRHLKIKNLARAGGLCSCSCTLQGVSVIISAIGWERILQLGCHYPIISAIGWERILQLELLGKS